MHSLHVMIVLVACLAAASCETRANDTPAPLYASCVASVARDAAGILSICGRLDESTVRLALDQIRPSDRELVLTSGGGFAPPSIVLAKAIRAQNITVRVRGFCLSACSTYVLLTAPRVLIEPNAIVAFHHTAAFGAEAVAHRTNTPASHPIWAQADEEREYFRSADMPADLLDRITLSVEPTCMGLRANGSGRDMLLMYRWEWFVPDFHTAQDMFGGRMSGYWPRSRAEAETLFASLRTARRQRVRYGALPEAISPAALAAKLPECQFQ